MKITPEYITELNQHEIFVFGSNTKGRHGAGAAKIAKEKFGAIYGQGFGLSGQTYAIATLDENFEKVPISFLKRQIKTFKNFVSENKDLHFLITEIGCGLAGFEIKDIAPLFEDFLSFDNCSLPERFLHIIQH